MLLLLFEGVVYWSHFHPHLFFFFQINFFDGASMLFLQFLLVKSVTPGILQVCVLSLLVCWHPCVKASTVEFGA